MCSGRRAECCERVPRRRPRRAALRAPSTAWRESGPSAHSACYTSLWRRMHAKCCTPSAARPALHAMRCMQCVKVRKPAGCQIEQRLLGACGHLSAWALPMEGHESGGGWQAAAVV